MTTNNSTNNFSSSPLTTKGDLYGYDTANNRFPVGSNYYYPMGDSTASLGVSYQLPILQDQIAFRTHADFFTGSLNGDGVLTASNSGTGASCAIVTSIDTLHPGILKMDMGTTTTGYAYVANGATFQATLYGNSTITVETCVYLNALSNGTNTYSMFFGQVDSGGPIVTPNGVWIGYSSSVNSGNWTINAHASGVTTTTNAASGPSAQIWYKLRLVINTATNLVTGYVGAVGSDFTSIGTVSATLTTVALWGGFLEFLKSAGTTDTFCYCDYLTTQIVFSSTR